MMLCYRDGWTRLMVNNNLSNEILIRSSVPQGCLFFPLFIVLYLEPLCRGILASQVKNGYIFSSCQVKLLAYADDAAYFCSDKRSVIEALCVTDLLCRITGARLHTTVLGSGYGSWPTTPSPFAGIIWNATS